MTELSVNIAVSTIVSTALATATPAKTSKTSAAFVLISQTNGRQAVGPQLPTEVQEQSIAVDNIVEVWDGKKNSRFKELARAEALRELSDEELIELDALTRLRRLHRYRRTADEILWERKQQKVTRTLVSALQQYVEFHDSTNNT